MLNVRYQCVGLIGLMAVVCFMHCICADEPKPAPPGEPRGKGEAEQSLLCEFGDVDVWTGIALGKPSNIAFLAATRENQDGFVAAVNVSSRKCVWQKSLSDPVGLCYDPNSGRIYVLNRSKNPEGKWGTAVVVLSGTTGEEERRANVTLDTPWSTAPLVFWPPGRSLYIGCEDERGDPCVAVIGAKDLTLTKLLPLKPVKQLWSADQRVIYADSYPPSPGENSPTLTSNGAGAPDAFTVDEVGGILYVTTLTYSTIASEGYRYTNVEEGIWAFDLKKGVPLWETKSPRVWGLALDPVKKRLYGGDRHAAVLRVMSAQDGSFIKSIRIGNDEPPEPGTFRIVIRLHPEIAMASDSARQRIYFPSCDGPGVTVFDTAKEKTVNNIPLQSPPRAITVLPGGTALLVACADGSVQQLRVD